MDLAVFYHCWVGGKWEEPWDEFLDAIGDARFSGGFYPRATRGTSEASTINELRRYAECFDGAILYAHTKGASDPSEFRARWRRSMTRRVVKDWRENLRRLELSSLLDAECRPPDAIGCHWLTEADHPGMFGAETIPAEGSGFFGGNFWMARCDYLRTLPVCESEPRWKAESWIGINHPRVVDLLPGWPHDNRWPELCTS